MRTRQAMGRTKLFGNDYESILPIINAQGSDLQMFDNTLEFLMLAGAPNARSPRVSAPMDRPMIFPDGPLARKDVNKPVHVLAAHQTG